MNVRDRGKLTAFIDILVVPNIPGEPLWKTWAYRLLFWIIALSVVTEATITFVIWAFNIPEERFGRHTIHVGQRCGPEHHWVYIGYDYAGDYSCERDR
jgi:hypothetical protein